MSLVDKHALTSAKKLCTFDFLPNLPITMDADLAEESRVQARQLGGHVLLVHVVELMEGCTRRKAPLHQVQYRYHP